jgi:C-terminal processing protease CtpA/Prc
MFEKAKDNIAWLLGLPATIGGAFGFLLDSGNEQAELSYQVTQLEDAVAELKAENDLLGGGVKNFSLDLSNAPGGSLTPILVGITIVILVGGLFWYQNRRRKRG